MPNRLAAETSPYLLQHAGNPVDWFPWGPEALARARAEDKPILLSIGYAACHWCHVMAHESFEDEETARLMNELYVNIKVDREERPDLDSIYMQAVQAMTGHGGWPMTVFLAPDGRPFYGGTYYPPEDRHGLPSFRRVLTAVAETWNTRRNSVEETASHLVDALTSAAVPEMSGEVTPDTLELAYRMFARTYDARYGGFGGAPKFPPSMSLDFLLRFWARTGNAAALDMVVTTYRAMLRGGVFDQIGGGLHRYSVDARWLVPHFEKMLYDNALFVRLGVHLWQATRDGEIRRAVESTVDWLLREMRSADGAFFSSLDADSEGHEGKFYVWDADELDAALGELASVAHQYWGVTPEGNFEGKNILFVPNEPRAVAVRLGMEAADLARIVAEASAALLGERARRVRPGRDEKILAAWNGLAVRALAEAARVFDREDYARAAVACGEFLSRRLVRNGRVLRVLHDHPGKAVGFLDDQAAVGLAFLDLYSLTFDPVWFGRAKELATSMVDWFQDPDSGFFFDTPNDHETLVARPREVMDNATPSGNSLAAELLVRTAEFSGDDAMRALGERIVSHSAGFLARYANGFGHLLCVADSTVFGTPEVAIIGDPRSAEFRSLVATVSRRFLPSLVLAGGTLEGDSGAIALLRDRGATDAPPRAFVCRRYVCDAPTSDPTVLETQLEGIAAHRS